MTDENVGEVTQILKDAALGDRSAIDRLYAMLYADLRALAHKRVRSVNNVSALDTTSLVHESYLRLVKSGKMAARNRNHFLAYAAHVMRSVVVDLARHAQARRRGGENVHVTLNTFLVDSIASPADEINRLNELLTDLSKIDERLVSVVEMRYFAALEFDQIAECLGISDRTVRRDLEKVRLLLMDGP